MSDKKTCYLCMPSYGSVTLGAARGIFRASDSKLDMKISFNECSLLAVNFNQHWCWALNAAANGKQVDYFAMLHSDIQPEDFWLDKLVDELESHKLDVLSVIVPIKDTGGLTSTALSEPDETWKPMCRLTMKEAFRLPETFTAADIGMADKILCINTGCWVCKFDPQWAKPPFAFTINDRIVWDEKENKYKPQVEPEDWNVSRQFHRLGLKVGVTRKVMVAHRGDMNFTNLQPWGTWDHDQAHLEQTLFPETQTHGLPEDWKFPAEVDGWLTIGEGKELAARATGKRVLEIGSWCGRSTICMAQTAKEIHVVDPFDGRATPYPRDTLKEFRANLDRYGINGQVVPHKGTTDDVGPCLAHSREFDFVFIDGAHDFDSVSNDIRWATQLLAKDGLIAFHDYRRPFDEGVTRAVNELIKSGGKLVTVQETVAVVKPPPELLEVI